MVNERGDSPGHGDASVLAIDLARQVVATMAPEENEVFDEVASSWRAGADAAAPPGASVGFGLESMLVSEIVLQVIAGSIVEVLGVGVVVARSRWQQWRQRRKGGTTTQLPAELPAAGGKIVMTSAQARQLRDVSRRHALALGLTESKADLLAGAVVGAVHLLDAPLPDGRG